MEDNERAASWAGKRSSVDARRTAFGAALARRRKDLSLSQTALGRALGGVAQSAVSQWECGGTQPRPNHVYSAERVLGFSPGELSRLLGYVPPSRSGFDNPPGDVRDAIRRDPLLTTREKRSLVSLYQSLVAGRGVRLDDEG